MIIDTTNSEHYLWGEICEGWHFVKTESLSVIRETMPPNTKERLHYHQRAQQFFYVLSGIATFEVDGSIHKVENSKGILIQPGTKHRILNNEKSMLEFLVISEPKSHGDRVNIE